MILEKQTHIFYSFIIVKKQFGNLLQVWGVYLISNKEKKHTQKWSKNNVGGKTSMQLLCSVCRSHIGYL